MSVAIAASVIGLVVVLIAYYRDPPLTPPPTEPPATWGPFPDPSEVSRAEFPLRFSGYDPATVELRFDALLRAYGDLLAVATPDVMQKAQRRAQLRATGEVATAPPPGQTPSPATQPAPNAGGDAVDAGDERVEPADRRDTPAPSSLAAPLSTEGADAEALRAEAALADLEARQQPERR
ncbi:MAG TPA: hypothetical protein VM307_09475 [Egibacteraceae bacterium]|nr:hypothetical protein [Egibacteraceae bacterium]